MGLRNIVNEKSHLLNKDAKKLEEENQEKEKYPKAVFFILGNEFCERFCYYGMRTVLTIYLTEELLYSGSKATIIFHSFIMLSYFTPLFGALLADSLLGKFKTILYISIVYAIGNVILSIGSIPNDLSTMKAVSLLGLFIIGIGTGGIKPCVSAFGGDQFSSRQEKERQKFFSVFYFAINSGSVLSTLLTPILRADVHCLGSDSCYPLAYGIPAALMVIALILFLIGKPLYKMKPAEGNIFQSVFKCICHAISRKTKSKEKKKSHWLDYADDKFDRDLIKDIKTLLHVLWVFIPVPIFWALFDQTGSSWTLQATKMNGEVLGYHVKPDQMQVMNSVLIIVLIPVFDYAVYPLFSKCNLLKKPLQRMAVGGFLSALSFVFAGFIELGLESGYPVIPGAGLSELTIINNSPCHMRILQANNSEIKLDRFEFSVLNDIAMGKEISWEFIPENCSETRSVTKQFNTSSSIESMMIFLQNNEIQVMKTSDSKQRTDDGEPKIKLYFTTDFEFSSNKTSFKLDKSSNQIYMMPNNTNELLTSGVTEYSKTSPGKYKIYLPLNDTAHEKEPVGEIDLKSGGIYIGVIYQSSSPNISNFMVISMVEPNTVSILWQIPSYVILTTGEIMFSITGLEFSYSQAPQSMKSIVQAAWLLTVAFGNLIVMIIAKLSLFEKKSYELFMFAVLMGLDMLGFSIMAYFFKYVEGSNYGSPKPDKNGKDNAAYEEETDFNK
ncbi:solute carrier family 15 member 1-like isoform X2 [Argiope bruennichi]|uniref:solute carrier family 15 member 1-like isoform X2 n=1 Tax=Argiope bruennichi TaxID=94029 RepID=UPI002494E198|nr:solute carrier family 15 member 1-like isoform X2 [Argiope bruennichi]